MTQIAVQIDGGVGRCICAIPALEKLAESREVIVLTGHPEVFYYHPAMHKVYGITREYLFDDVIQHCEFVFPEPYWDYHYYQRRRHLTESFYALLNKGDPPGKLKPVIYISKEEDDGAREYIKNIKTQIGSRKIVAFQPFGAGFDPSTGVDNSNRSMTYATVDFIFSNLTDECCFLNFSSVSMKNKSLCVDEFPLRKRFALSQYCDYFIGVDSFAAHVCYSMGIPGTQFMGSTNATNVGYPDYYHTVYREGYPKGYVSYRISGCVDKNQGAMNFSEQELANIISDIRAKIGGA